jgi:hypothetical protein
MGKELIEDTLKAMGYKPEALICKKCKYFSEIENAYVDRMWDSVCQFSNVAPNMPISLNGCCDRFARGRL